MEPRMARQSRLQLEITGSLGDGGEGRTLSPNPASRFEKPGIL